MKWEMPRKEFEALVQSIPRAETAAVDTGSEWFKPRRPLTREERRKLESQCYQLTEKGTQAVDLIISSVASQLKTTPPTDKAGEKR